MGAITDIVTGDMGIAVLASYLFLRIAPQVARMVAGRKKLAIEKHNEENDTRTKGELNEVRLDLNSKTVILWQYEDRLAAQQRSNGKLKKEREALEEGVKTSKELIAGLDGVIDDVNPNARAAFTYDGVAKIEIIEQARSESQSGSTADTTTRRNLGMPPTTAGELLGPDSTSQGDTTAPPRQQQRPKRIKDNGRSL